MELKIKVKAKINEEKLKADIVRKFNLKSENEIRDLKIEYDLHCGEGFGMLFVWTNHNNEDCIVFDVDDYITVYME